MGRAVEVTLDLSDPGGGAGVVVPGHHPARLEELDHADAREPGGGGDTSIVSRGRPPKKKEPQEKSGNGGGKACKGRDAVQNEDGKGGGEKKEKKDVGR